MWALHGVFVAALAPLMVAGDTLGDLELYREWAVAAADGTVVGIDEPWVYPLLAWLPIGAAGLTGPAFLATWIAITTLLDALALRALLHFGDGQADPRGAYAAWIWLATLFVLSPVGLLRLEGITGPLVVIALATLATRPGLAGALLAVATWIKVWPAVLVAGVVAVMESRWSVVRAGIAVTAGVVLLAAAFGGTRHLASFLTIQSDRALQLEAPIATPWVWLAMLDVPGSDVYQNVDIATREVVGPFDGGALMLSTPLMAMVCCLALVAAWIAVRTGSDRMDVLCTTGLVMATALFVCNRVGSPQYMLWLLPIAVVGVLVGSDWWRRQARMLLVIGLMTTLVFPITYLALVDLQPWAVLLLTARNVLLVAVLFTAGRRLAKLGAAPERTLVLVRA